MLYGIICLSSPISLDNVVFYRNVCVAKNIVLLLNFT